MEKQKEGMFESAFWFCYGLFMLGLFGVLTYAFWQNGLMTSWLSGLGYIALAFFITVIINTLLIMAYFAFAFFSRLFDTAFEFTFPSKNKAA
ncbi:hypothetical protein [Pasteurella bettyae]|uniref:Uncharacterized protein n=1 Tax=Pasteurella bettyae CCUG 2042 TaxID=1095749 RepID=I3D8T1_9PAST|nr:hypothetical protein [Pasteurella bettyae]EIJ68124.1 hypothetical protein HMPREF1052_1209 [Pasteurella bettyae CCUG 2042]SUB22560.1 Uncharacterised protein [Pasteurella bettyae]